MYRSLALFLWLAAFGFSNALEPVSIQLKWYHQAQFAGYYAAKEQGFYAQEGLDVTLHERTQGVDNVRRVLEGHADYAVTDASLILRFVQGDPVVMVAPVFQYSPLVFLTLEQSRLNTPADLAGKRVMMYKDGLEGISLLLMLKMEKVDIGSLQIQPPSFDIADLAEGRTDAFFAYTTNEPYLLKELGIQGQTIDPKTYGISFYEDILFTSRSEAIERPDRVEKIRRATLRGWQWALDNPEETIEIIKTRYGCKKSRDALRYELAEIRKLIRPEIFAIGQINHNKLNAIAENMAELGLIEADFSLSGLVFEPSRAALELSDEERAFLAAHPVIRMGNDIAWPPFDFVDAEGRHQGLAADYMKLIAQRLGVRFDHVKDLDWASVIDGAKNRTLDIFACAVATPQRQVYMDFSTPYLSFPMVIATGDQVAYLRGPDDLEGRAVGVVKEYASHDMLRLHYPQLSVVTFDSVGAGLEALSQGRIYAFVDNLGTISHEIKQLGLANLKITGEFPHRYELAIGVRKDWPLLSSAMQKALDSITPAERDAIYHRWIALRYQHEMDYTLLWQVLGGAGALILIFLWWNRTLQTQVRKRREAEARFRGLAESTFEAIGIHRGGKILEVNQAVTEVFGYSRAELLKMRPTDLFTQAGAQTVAQKIAQGAEGRYEAEARHKDGHAFFVEIRARMVPFLGAMARVTSIRDITEQKRAEAALREAKAITDQANEALQKRVEEELQKRRGQEQMLIQQSKMAAMGEMIAAIAHQWKQPLTALSLVMQDLEDAQESGTLDGGYLHSSIQNGLRQIGFMSQTVDDFRNFLRPSREKILFDAAVEAAEVARLFGRQFERQGVALNVQADPRARTQVLGYPGEFKQVLLNLISNARDAIRARNEGGHVTLRIDEAEGRTRIRVEDDGGGIDAQTMATLFTPYHTTKGESGTGIGLYLSRTIIEGSMDGTIHANNHEKGACFTILLPKPKETP
ncbi:MAG: ABC transporter substrate-binding protein [Campylobacterales bacterium]